MAAAPYAVVCICPKGELASGEWQPPLEQRIAADAAAAQQSSQGLKYAGRASSGAPRRHLASCLPLELAGWWWQHLRCSQLVPCRGCLC